MRPEDIQNRDFLVGMRGYDKDDVRAFLAEVAADHAAMQIELETRASAPTPVPPPAPSGADDFENLGASVAAILRAAKGSAAEVSLEAEARATELRDDADRYAASLRQQAEDVRAEALDAAASTKADAEAKAEALRGAAQASLDEAHAEAERILRDATDKARAIEIESEAREKTKVEETARREAALRARLLEASDELQLTLMALDGKAPEVDIRADAVHDGEMDEHLDQLDDAPAWS